MERHGLGPLGIKQEECKIFWMKNSPFTLLTLDSYDKALKNCRLTSISRNARSLS
jgi:hypothetical protein